MSRRRGATAIAANPVLVGVATVLVIIVAVFLSYNANNGLPWIPSYRLKADVPSAANLVKGNEVRIGGKRVGVIEAIEAKTLENGRVIAQLNLKLETKVRPLPDDSTLIVRPRSALGLKYVEITRGDSTTSYAEGSTIPLKAYTVLPVDIDQFYGMFSAKTRIGIRGNQTGFGNGFSGRGADINSALHTFVPTLQKATKVLANIAAPETQFDRFFASQARTAAIIAPIATTQGELFANLDTTFTAWASVAYPYLQETISKGPEGLQTATETFPQIRPLLRNTQEFFATLKPGAAATRRSIPELADAVSIGARALEKAPALNKQLGDFFVALQAFSEDPFVPLGFNDLFQTVATLDPTVAFLTPAQTTCNYVNLFFNNIAGILSEGDSTGNWARFAVLVGPSDPVPNSIWGPAGAPASGGDPGGLNYLHNNPYPNTAAPGQPKECEPGNMPYLNGQTVIGNAPGTQPAKTDKASAPTEEDTKKEKK